MGLTFPSPFGLAAGFDKGGKGIAALAGLGFGHIEIGTITGQAQPGNPQPRLFRLIEDKAVINRMGFNNDGAAAAGPRVASARADLETEYRPEKTPHHRRQHRKNKDCRTRKRHRRLPNINTYPSPTSRLPRRQRKLPQHPRTTYTAIHRNTPPTPTSRTRRSKPSLTPPPRASHR